jgi:hypothetical protein
MSERHYAYVVHRTRNRIRLKVPAQRCNESFFTRLQRQLAEHPEIVSIDVNPLTASVLIVHHAGFRSEELCNPFLGLELATGEDLPRVRQDAHQRISELDRRIQQLSAGEVDLAAVLLKLTVAVATRQAGWHLLEWMAETLLRAAIKSVAARRNQVGIGAAPGPVPLAT